MMIFFFLLASVIPLTYLNQVAYGHSPSIQECAITFQDDVCNVDIVGIGQPYFLPNEIIILKGASITWENHDIEGLGHSVTSTISSPADKAPKSNGMFDSDILAPGESSTIVFDQSGVFNYYCTLHPHERGTIIVLDQEVPEFSTVTILVFSGAMAIFIIGQFIFKRKVGIFDSNTR